MDAAYAKAVDFACITHNHVGHCIEPHLAAHSSYLLDFTMPFEITVGDYRIYPLGRPLQVGG